MTPPTATILPGAEYLSNPDADGATHIERWRDREWFIYDLGHRSHKKPWVTFGARPADYYAVHESGRVRFVTAEAWRRLSQPSRYGNARYVLQHTTDEWEALSNRSGRE